MTSTLSVSTEGEADAMKPSSCLLRVPGQFEAQSDVCMQCGRLSKQLRARSLQPAWQARWARTWRRLRMLWIP